MESNKGFFFVAQVGRYHLFILVTANPIINKQIRVGGEENDIGLNGVWVYI